MNVPEQDTKNTATPGGESGVCRQLVYRQVRDGELPAEERQGVAFQLLAGMGDARPHRAALARVFGHVGWLKVCVKLAALKRLLYVVIVEGRIVNWGWITVSFCRHYPVKDGDVVIGPLQTEEADRGQGYATWGLKHAINAMVRRGHRVFFINTWDNNFVMRKVIAACGFGAPIPSYPRAGARIGGTGGNP